MFPVRLPSLAKESSAISADCQLSAAGSESSTRRDGSACEEMGEGLTFFDSIRLSDLDISHAQRTGVDIQSSRPTSLTIPVIPQQ
jgi:hypothetical protein